MIAQEVHKKILDKSHFITSFQRSFFKVF